MKLRLLTLFSLALVFLPALQPTLARAEDDCLEAVGRKVDGALVTKPIPCPPTLDLKGIEVKKFIGQDRATLKALLGAPDSRSQDPGDPKEQWHYQGLTATITSAGKVFYLRLYPADLTFTPEAALEYLGLPVMPPTETYSDGSLRWSPRPWAEAPCLASVTVHPAPKRPTEVLSINVAARLDCLK